MCIQLFILCAAGTPGQLLDLEAHRLQFPWDESFYGDNAGTSILSPGVVGKYSGN